MQDCVCEHTWLARNNVIHFAIHLPSEIKQSLSAPQIFLAKQLGLMLPCHDSSCVRINFDAVVCPTTKLYYKL